MCARLLNCHPAPRWNVTRAHGWQGGGGLYIWGTATLTNTKVYENQAGWESSGGGLYISGTATLTYTNVYANKAGNVRSPFEHSLHFHPAPR